MEVGPGGFMYPKLKQKFSDALSWTAEFEVYIRKLCYNIESPNKTEDHKLICDQFTNIYKILLERNVAKKEDLTFLQDEIMSYHHNAIISKQVSTNKRLSEELLEKYTNIHGKDVEGVFGINESLNVEQVREIAIESYARNDKLKFLIPKTNRVRGQIIVEMFGLQNISVASVYKRNSRADKVTLFDEPTPRGWVLSHDIGTKFYSYQFISSNGEDYTLLSTKKLEQGRYNVTGLEMSVRDVLFIGEQSKLNSKKKVFIVNIADPVIAKYKTVDDYRKGLARLDVSREKHFEYLFLTNEKNPVVLKHPKWFKHFIWSWFLHAPVGRGDKYPFHIMTIAKKNSGKSWLIDGIYNKSLESQNVFSGTGGSIKGLVPSFATKSKPKLGYLARCHRFAFADELLKIFRNGGHNETIEDVAQLNDMLEHKNRVITTGNGGVEVNFSARMFSAGNPIKGMKMNNMTDLLSRFDESFVSRLVVYFQNDKHIKMIRDSDEEELTPYIYKINKDEFMSLVDYLHSFNANWDFKRVKEIYKKYKGVFNPKIEDYYDSRFLHHTKCILDGLVKSRCLFSHDTSFRANDQDYKWLDTILKHLTSSWVSAKDIKFMPRNDRWKYLPENVLGLYNYLDKLGRVFGLNEMGSVPNMSKVEAKNALVVLIELELVVEVRDGYSMWNRILKQAKLEDEK